MNNRYAITFGEVSILHVGGKEYGEKRDEIEGVGYPWLDSQRNSLQNYCLDVYMKPWQPIW